jgi:hypothetical protein
MKFGNWLETIGIDLTLMFTGMMGSVLMATKKNAWDLKRSVIGIISGMLSANYLTQIFIEVFELEGRSQYGVAFLLGYFGLKGVEKFIERYHKTHGNTEEESKP